MMFNINRCRIGIIALISVSFLLVLYQYRRYSTTDYQKEEIKRVGHSQIEQKIKSFHHIIDLSSPLPVLQAPEIKQESEILEQRRNSIKDAFLHGWHGYKQYAFGSDELKPLSNQSHNPFGGLGATVIDSLSTMLVMELHDEVHHLLPWIEKVNVTINEPISVFETIIRCMGGLLSAYELSEHSEKVVFLNKAEEIGHALLPAFDTPFGIPYYHFNPYK